MNQTTIQNTSVQYFGDFEAWKRSGVLNYWAMRLIPTIRTASRMLYYRIG